jgi:hypothetical protein
MELRQRGCSDLLPINQQLDEWPSHVTFGGHLRVVETIR